LGEYFSSTKISLCKRGKRGCGGIMRGEEKFNKTEIE